jgi:hypothetical protein
MSTIPLGPIGPSPVVRAAAVRRGRLLNRLTIGWNAVEGVVAVAAGLAAGSVSLVGFGLDSGIEVSAALILAWRLAQERHRTRGRGALGGRRTPPTTAHSRRRRDRPTRCAHGIGWSHDAR